MQDYFGQINFPSKTLKKEQNNSPNTMKFSSHSSFSTTFCLKRLLLSLSRIYNQKKPPTSTKPLEHRFSMSKKGFVSFRSESRITVQLRAYWYLSTKTQKVLKFCQNSCIHNQHFTNFVPQGSHYFTPPSASLFCLNICRIKPASSRPGCQQPFSFKMIGANGKR